MNINSIQNKLESLANIIKGNIGILSESSYTYNSFPEGQFFFNSSETPFRLDRDRNGRAVMLFIRNEIHTKFVFTNDKAIKSFYID